MLKTTAITVLSLSALLFSGYTKNTCLSNKNVEVAITRNLPANNSINRSLKDTTLLKAGDKSPDIVFQDTSGKDVRISDLKGKYVLIDVWASWCYPCRVQYPHLVLLEEKMKNKAITFVSISCDTRDFRWKGSIQNLKMGGLQWMVKDELFAKVYGANTIPRFILLDKKGNIMNLNMPMPSHPELEQELNKLKGI